MEIQNSTGGPITFPDLSIAKTLERPSHGTDSCNEWVDKEWLLPWVQIENLPSQLLKRIFISLQWFWRVFPTKFTPKKWEVETRNFKMSQLQNTHTISYYAIPTASNSYQLSASTQKMTKLSTEHGKAYWQSKHRQINLQQDLNLRHTLRVPYSQACRKSLQGIQASYCLKTISII